MTVAVAVAPFLVGSLAPRIALDMSLTNRELGLAMAGYYLLSGLLSPTGGRVVDVLGTTTSLRWACALSTLGLAGLSRAGSAVEIIVVLTLLGIPNAVVQPACNDVLARLDRPRIRAVSFGVLQASIPASTLVAALVLGVAGSGISWRWTVVGVAIITILIQAAVPRVPHQVPIRATTTAADDPGEAACLPAHGSPVFLLVLVTTGLLASAAVTTLPSFAAMAGNHAHLTAWTVATAQTLGSVGSATMRVIAPAITSHAHLDRRLFLVAFLQGIGVLGFLGLASGTTPGFFVGMILGFSFGWGFNGLFNLIVTSIRPQQIARSTGLTQAGIFLGGAAGPLIFAGIARGENYRAGWLAMALFIGTAATLTAFLAARSRTSDSNRILAERAE